jgi:hypothetical protein
VGEETAQGSFGSFGVLSGAFRGLNACSNAYSNASSFGSV